MTKLTDEEKAAKAETKAAEKAKKEAIAKAKAEAEQKNLVTVECICKNVHLGNGKILRAYRDSPEDNWSDGDVAQVSHADAVFMKSQKQVKIL